MYICICNAVNEKMVQAAIDAGARSVQDLQIATGLASDCGKCALEARRILSIHTADRASSQDTYAAHPRLMVVA